MAVLQTALEQLPVLLVGVEDRPAAAGFADLAGEERAEWVEVAW